MKKVLEYASYGIAAFFMLMIVWSIVSSGFEHDNEVTAYTYSPELSPTPTSATEYTQSQLTDTIREYTHEDYIVISNFQYTTNAYELSDGTLNEILAYADVKMHDPITGEIAYGTVSVQIQNDEVICLNVLGTAYVD
jgi:hypothetical protein